MDFPAVELVVGVVGRAVIASAAEDDHVSVFDGRGRVEIAPGGGRAGSDDVRPRHRQEAEAVDLVGKAVFVLFVTAEDVHGIADDAGRVTVASPRQIPVGCGTRPGLEFGGRGGVWGKKGIWNRRLFLLTQKSRFLKIHCAQYLLRGPFWSASGGSGELGLGGIEAVKYVARAIAVVASTPNERLVIPRHASMAISLVRDGLLPFLIPTTLHHAPTEAKAEDKMANNGT